MGQEQSCKLNDDYSWTEKNSEICHISWFYYVSEG